MDDGGGLFDTLALIVSESDQFKNFSAMLFEVVCQRTGNQCGHGFEIALFRRG